MENLTVPQLFAIWILPVLFAITIHEAAHGWVAFQLGDDTAKILGRITFNPLKHIHWFGTILLPIFLLLFTGVVFGFAKPVPINWTKLKHPKRDMALVAISGPLANFGMIFLWALIAKLGLYFLSMQILWARALVYMGFAGININLILMILNLLPIPPLDGSRILFSLFPLRISERLQNLQMLGLLLLLLLIFSGLLQYMLIIPLTYIHNAVLTLFGIPS